MTVLPSRDQCLFAVHGSTGLASVEDIGRAKFPLKLGLRGREAHLLHSMLDDIFGAAGFSLADIMCQDTPEAPLGVPLHPAAEAFWKQQGHL